MIIKLLRSGNRISLTSELCMKYDMKEGDPVRLEDAGDCIKIYPVTIVKRQKVKT